MERQGANRLPTYDIRRILRALALDPDHLGWKRHFMLMYPPLLVLLLLLLLSVVMPFVVVIAVAVAVASSRQGSKRTQM